MTHTYEIEYHRDRAIVHFGSPEGSEYWRETEDEKSKVNAVKYTRRMRKKGIR